MGTRHDICVFSDGEMKVQQYSQWDGYTSVAGKNFINWVKDNLQSQRPNSYKHNIEEFKKKVALTREATEEYIQEFKNILEEFNTKTSFQIPLTVSFDIFHRDTSVGILDKILEIQPYEYKEGKYFPVELDYRCMMLEFAYVIDLDKEMVYFLTTDDFKGKSKAIPAKITERFADGMKCWYKVKIQELPDYATVERIKNSIELNYDAKEGISY